MIALAADCLVFQTPSGESVPFFADMISPEMMGEAAQAYDAEFVQHAANAVFHYFKHDMGRQTVTVGEFAGALEKVLHGFKLKPEAPVAPPDESRPRMLETDLRRLACESGMGCELFFFPRLRDELRHQLSQWPRVLRFWGLRGCVKQLVGARRWTSRCGQLEDQIVDFLRGCLNLETGPRDFALVVE